MQKDLGLVLREAIAKSNISITNICDQLRKDRSWLYYQFRRKNIPMETMMLIGNVIRHDFTEDIPELKKLSTLKSFNENQTDRYGKGDEEFWKNKYYALLEEHLQLLKQIKLPEYSNPKSKRKS